MEELHAIPRSEHPRPDWLREAPWSCLNGPWKFAFDDHDEGLDKGWQFYQPNDDTQKSAASKAFHHTITVPFAFQTEASGVNDKGIHEVVWYARDISMPSDQIEARQLLHFGAVDYEATVFVDGGQVTHHRGGHVPFYADITPQLLQAKKSDRKTVPLVVRVVDPPHDVTVPRGKQYWKASPESIFYWPTSGIWQSVWLEQAPRSRMEKAKVIPDIDRGSIDVDVHLLGVGSSSSVQDARLSVIVSLAGVHISSTEVVISKDTASASCTLTVSVPGSSPPESIRQGLYGSGVLPPELEGDSWSNGLALWSPEHPSLYDIELRLCSCDGEMFDSVKTYTGMRKVSINKEGKVCLNNRSLFMALNLDQGYWPKSHLTAPSDGALKEDIVKMKEIGMNGARTHQRVVDPRYLYHADKLGYLVWAEMPNAYDYSFAYVERFKSEWIEAIKRDINHPSIIAWVPINESWGVPKLATSQAHRDHLISLYHLTRSLDESRFIIDNDGWEHCKTSLCTFHDYAEHHILRNTCASLDLILYEKAGRNIFNPGHSYEGQPIILSEMGGVSLADGAQGWGYNQAQSNDDLLGRIKGLIDAVIDGGIVQGYCYTQTADCETEVNGLLTSDRKHKLDPKKLREIFGRRP